MSRSVRPALRHRAIGVLAATMFLSGTCVLPAQSVDSIVRAAIIAAGGAAAITRFRALEWDARAAVHVPGVNVELTGLWRVQPPDSAVSATWETAKGPAATRRLIVAGPRGWLQRDTALTPMPDAVLAEERHQFYLYSLLRIVPLLDAGVSRTLVPRDSAGRAGVRVERAGRLPVTVYFDASARVARLITTFATAGGKPGDAQDVRLNGTIESNGIRWFRRMAILRNGQPYFEMNLTALRTLPALVDPLLAGVLRR